jgi:effector-binding domain-containing protein
MTDASIVVKPLDGTRLALTSQPAEGFDVDFAPIFAELYPRLFGALGQAGVQPTGPTWALYDERSDGRIDVFAAAPVAADAEVSDAAVELRDIEPVTRAATLIHHGPMATVRESYAAMQQWLDTAGETPVGFSREVYLDCPEEQADWVTEIQFVLA